VQLLTRNGHDWSGRFPLIAEAAGALRVRSSLWTARRSPAAMMALGVYRHQDGAVFLYAIDLLELNGDDLRREPRRW
jgi:bifunctional non-homologous end joining protein LigD